MHTQLSIAEHSAHGIDLAPMLANVRAPTGTLISVVDQAHLGGIYDITFTTSE